MKKWSAICALVLVLCLAGCSSGGGKLGDFAHTEEGYILEGLSYGCSVEAAEKALGLKLTKKGSTSVPFSSEIYIADSAEFQGLDGALDLQFTEGALYAMTFAAKGAGADMDAAFDAACARYESAFGAPDEVRETDDDGAVYSSETWLWEDAASGTRFMADLADFGDYKTFQVSAVKPPQGLS